jgi:hypothetical protein
LEGVMKKFATTKTISAKALSEFVEETMAFAKAVAQPIRGALREKNAREMADRLTLLVGNLSVGAEAMNDEFDATVGADLD